MQKTLKIRGKYQRLNRKMSKCHGQTMQKMIWKWSLNIWRDIQAYLQLEKYTLKLHWDTICHLSDWRKLKHLKIHYIDETVRHTVSHCWWKYKFDETFLAKKFGHIQQNSTCIFHLIERSHFVKFTESTLPTIQKYMGTWLFIAALFVIV